MTRRPRAVVRTAVGVALVMMGAIATAPAWAASDAGTGTPLSVTISDGSTPTPTSSGAAGGGVSGSGSTSGGSRGGGVTTGTSVGGGAGTGGTPVSGQSSPGETSVGGGLYVGGLNGSGTPQLDPSDGRVDVWFTVRNASTTAIDASATFWMDAPVFVIRIDSDDVAIPALQPGETRVVSATLHGAGQWTLLSTHVTFTPPDTVDGAALTPVTRDALILLFPWLAVMIAVVLVMAVLVVRVTRSALSAVPAVAAS